MIKLHLGCGIRKFPGWKHFDMGDYKHLDGHDIIHLPYKDNSVDIIYSSHTLEYFDRKEVVVVLKEWYRVLRQGGIIRLAVPDFRAIARLYMDSWVSTSCLALDIEVFLGPLYGKMTPIGCEQSIYHKTAYDFRSLKKVLTNIGFTNIKTYDRWKTSHSNIDDHSAAYLPHMDFDKGILISLNVEATK